MFMLVYFVSFGVVDFNDLVLHRDLPDTGLGAGLSKAEVVILLGGLMLVLGYRVTALLMDSDGRAVTAREWPLPTILFIGLMGWVAGTVATYRWYVYIIPDTTDESMRRGLASLGSLWQDVYLLGQMCQPLGILLLVYAFRVTRSPILFALVIVIVLVQMLIGFIADVKGLAMLGLILVMVTSVLVDGKVPKAWLVLGLLFVTFLFPLYTSYRATIHGAGIARATVLENFAAILQKTIAAEHKVNSGKERAPTFLERSSVKATVEVIVAKAGNSVEFARGYTLSPIPQAFIPKIVWSDKKWIPAGQLLNKQFHVVEGDEVFISGSHLGELYWNFGWSGVVLGMTIIGVICAWVGTRFNVAEYRTATRVLVTIITIKQLIVSFESSISDCYVVWLRSLAGIGLLHLLFARIPVAGRATSERARKSFDSIATSRPFPNLLT